jgi:hypothetical protein
MLTNKEKIFCFEMEGKLINNEDVRAVLTELKKKHRKNMRLVLLSL